MKHLPLKENHLFVKAYTGGARFSGRLVSVFVLRDRAAAKLRRQNPEKQTLNRLGISASKKVGGAVIRSRLRRIIRAAFAEVEAKGIKSGYIIVISAREGAIEAKSTDVARELIYAMRKLGMMTEQKTDQ